MASSTISLENNNFIDCNYVERMDENKCKELWTELLSSDYNMFLKRYLADDNKIDYHYLRNFADGILRIFSQLESNIIMVNIGNSPAIIVRTLECLLKNDKSKKIDFAYIPISLKATNVKDIDYSKLHQMIKIFYDFDSNKTNNIVLIDYRHAGKTFGVFQKYFHNEQKNVRVMDIADYFGAHEIVGLISQMEGENRCIKKNDPSKWNDIIETKSTKFINEPNIKCNSMISLIYKFLVNRDETIKILESINANSPLRTKEQIISETLKYGIIFHDTIRLKYVNTQGIEDEIICTAINKEDLDFSYYRGNIDKVLKRKLIVCPFNKYLHDDKLNLMLNIRDYAKAIQYYVFRHIIPSFEIYVVDIIKSEKIEESVSHTLTNTKDIFIVQLQIGEKVLTVEGILYILKNIVMIDNLTDTCYVTHYNNIKKMDIKDDQKGGYSKYCLLTNDTAYYKKYIKYKTKYTQLKDK